MKLIASDMDGTLLQNDSMQVSNRAIHLIQQLTQKGYLFAAASGRQYPNLKRLFKEASKDMAFICENGAVVFYQDKLLIHNPMEHNLALQLCHDIYNQTGCEVLISGIQTSYLKPKHPSFLYHMRHTVKYDVQIVDSFEDIKESIIKVSVFQKEGVVENSADYFTKRWEDKFKCTISGFAWLDFVSPKVNKGASLLSLMDFFQIPRHNTFAFGDNYNDIEMLQTVEHGYIMENAVDELKQLFPLKAKLVEDELEKILWSCHTLGSMNKDCSS